VALPLRGGGRVRIELLLILLLYLIWLRRS